MTVVAPDEDVRAEVLDPGRSFLVQAPAGAGKTELLIRRYLGLLARAAEPEEVLAITFTRKAAAEMRRRVLHALESPDPGHGVASLARAVRERDAARGWRLRDQPARLRISTIDALNASLARAAPLRSGANVLRPVAETPADLYAEAARQLLELLGDAGDPAGFIADLLDHLDNRVPRLAALLAGLLARRDQWLPVVGAGGGEPAEMRRRLEQSLQRVVDARLREFLAALGPGLQSRVEAVVAQAAAHLDWTPPAPPPAGDEAARLEAELARWHLAARVLLRKKEPTWRQQVTVREGFPSGAAGRAAKEQATALLADLAGRPDLAAALHEVRLLPFPRYPAHQWRALEALVRLLPLAAAQLRVVLAEQGATDFTEIAADALAALGTEEVPEDTALGLDARVRHLLMDEFQDTSQAQYALLAALTRGWTPGDGRTVFLVGDPMQSIYRFRQAEVRLFLGARDQGLPDVPLAFRRLRANFRSVPAVVDWVNDTFRQVFPPADDPLVSAVAYVPCEPVRPGEEDSGVHYHDLTGGSAADEGERVADLVADALRRWPDQDIGILVRSRSHAAPTVAALLARQIPFVAVEQLHLGDTALASDLLALTRCLNHPADRLAWLAVLRAPWCGLTLADLAVLGEEEPHRPVVERARDPAVRARLSADGRRRLDGFLAAWDRAAARRGQVDLRDLVEGLWIEVGGPACAGPEGQYADALLALVARHNRGGDCPDPVALAADFAARPDSVGAAGARVQILTIHKAKGLQFDTVIVPRLGARTRTDDRPALLWEEVPGPGARPELLLAPVNGAGTDKDPLYELLWRLQRQQAWAEADRQLYVAATRAIRRLHLLGACRAGAGEGPPRPEPGSLLSRLWPAVGEHWRRAGSGADREPHKDQDQAPATPAPWVQVPLHRLPAAWERPVPPPPVPWAPDPGAAIREAPEFDWASRWARDAGTVVHRWLRHLARGDSGIGSPESLDALLPRWRRELAALGVDAGDLDRAARRVREALARTLADPEGRWLLSPEHGEARTEWELTMVAGDGFRRLVLDRSFVDAQGVRWIVDYKTSSHEGGDVEQFLAAEAERYRAQLAAYRAAVEALDGRPVRTALYFPLLGRLLPVDTVGTGATGNPPR